MTRILIVGGGYAGFYTAWNLEKRLRRSEATVTMVDPRPYMTYQPFLPEVAAGSIDPRYALVPHRRHLKRTEIVTASVSGINHAKKTATITPPVGDAYELEYDIVVITAGSVSRTFPIPGVADQAIGMKNIEEAIAVRDRILTNFDKAALLPAGPERDRLLTFVVVGGGFAGIEAFAEMRSLASYLVRQYPTISFEDTHFHLGQTEAGARPIQRCSARGPTRRHGVGLALRAEHTKNALLDRLLRRFADRARIGTGTAHGVAGGNRQRRRDQRDGHQGLDHRMSP